MYCWLPEISPAQFVLQPCTVDVQPAAEFLLLQQMPATLPGGPWTPSTPSPDFSR
jgi:hypothetical protein